ncbi:MAG: large conductance mechanosensitive channel protein MscL [Selenomonadaceae bacterium]|nr:large conductance mechanosensitive channel protein MscL [Selenomonadaceae bacterium]
MFDEWKKFLSRGNFIDLATGMVIGAAFSKIVSSFTADILMPPLGLLIGKIDFSNLFISLTGESYSSLAAAKEAGAPVIAYGAFLNVCLDFVIVATAIFILIKQINRFMPAPPPPAPDPRKCPYCKETVADDATKCPHCASDISASVVSK